MYNAYIYNMYNIVIGIAQLNAFSCASNKKEAQLVNLKSEGM